MQAQIHSSYDIPWTLPSSCTQYKKLLWLLFCINILDILKNVLLFISLQRMQKEIIWSLLSLDFLQYHKKARGNQDKLTHNSVGFPFLLHLRTSLCWSTGWMTSFLKALLRFQDYLSWFLQNRYTNDVSYQLQVNSHRAYHIVSK